jgi:hypothetical protein
MVILTILGNQYLCTNVPFLLDFLGQLLVRFLVIVLVLEEFQRQISHFA